MGLFGRKNNKTTLNLMEMTPCPLYKHEETEEGLINVLVPRFTDKFLGKYLQPRLPNKYIKANLDEFGTAVWRLMDCKKKVREISNLLYEKFGEEIQPVDERLSLFVSNLYSNDFITFYELKKGQNYG